MNNKQEWVGSTHLGNTAPVLRVERTTGIGLTVGVCPKQCSISDSNIVFGRLEKGLDFSVRKVALVKRVEGSLTIPCGAMASRTKWPTRLGYIEAYCMALYDPLKIRFSLGNLIGIEAIAY